MESGKLSTGYVMWDAGTTFDAVAGSVTNVDYNGKYNYATTTTTASPDATALPAGITPDHPVAAITHLQPQRRRDHDVSANPRLWIPLLSASALFGSASSISASLSAPHGRAAGQLRRRRYCIRYNQRFFFGQTVNYRCITAHTSTSGTGATAKPAMAHWAPRRHGLPTGNWHPSTGSANPLLPEQPTRTRRSALWVSPAIEVARLYFVPALPRPFVTALRVTIAVLGSREFQQTTRSLTKLTALRSGISTRYGVSA